MCKGFSCRKVYLTLSVRVSIFVNTLVNVVPLCINIESTCRSYPALTLTFNMNTNTRLRCNKCTCRNVKLNIARNIREVPDNFLSNFLIDLLVVFGNITAYGSITCDSLVCAVNNGHIILSHSYVVG